MSQQTTPRLTLAQWGRDHWSMLAYVEARCVDNRGVLRNANLRTHADRHPLFVARGPLTPGDGSSYPTRLKEGIRVHHDDWDCLYDMVQAGLATVTPRERALWDVPAGRRGPIKKGGQLQTKELRVRVKLTKRGNQLAGELRTHLTGERKYQTFRPSVPV